MHDTISIRRRLSAGVIAGPLFVGLVLLLMATEAGYDLGHQPISMLMLGDFGWIQIANYVVAGLLAIIFAVGVRRAVPTGRGHTAGPILLGVFGLGLIAGGLFVPDPALGFPPGTPDGIPTSFSWHATLHAIAPPMGFTGLVLATLVFARRFATDGRTGWVVYSLLTGVVALVLSVSAGLDGGSVRLFLGVGAGWAWVGALAVHLINGLPDTEVSVNPLTA